MRQVFPRIILLSLLMATFAIPQASAQGSSAWRPAMNTSWQWQLSTLPSSSQLLRVGMYDVDGFDASASLVSAMHSKGIKAVCYVDVGTWENWRSDAKAFPAYVKGKSNGWPGEKWLDIRQINVLTPIMTARFEMCLKKGFDAVEPDNIDGYSNSTGFSLSSSDQLAYNKFIAETVHSLGLTVALKNDVDQAKALLPYFDFAINEECFAYNECSTLQPFIAAGKAVFEVEYSLSPSRFCPKANSMNFNSMLKDEDLTAYRVACR
jgi:hypothetical protein